MPEMYRCLWPGCLQLVPEGFGMCKRHHFRLPDKLRGWFGTTFKREELAQYGTRTMKVLAACMAFARQNPDPRIPPFRQGQRIRVVANSMYTPEGEYMVELCVLNDRKQWIVITTDGINIAASELEATKPIEGQP